MTRANFFVRATSTTFLGIVFLFAAGCAQNTEQPVDQFQATGQKSHTPQDIAVKDIRLYFVNGADGARSVTDIQKAERVAAPKITLRNDRETIATAMTLPPGRFNQVNNFNFDLWGDASSGGTSSGTASQEASPTASQDVRATMQLLLQAVAGLKAAVDQLGGLARDGGTASPTSGPKTQTTDVRPSLDVNVQTDAQDVQAAAATQPSPEAPQ